MLHERILPYFRWQRVQFFGDAASKLFIPLWQCSQKSRFVIRSLFISKPVPCENFWKWQAAHLMPRAFAWKSWLNWTGSAFFRLKVRLPPPMAETAATEASMRDTASSNVLFRMAPPIIYGT